MKLVTKTGGSCTFAHRQDTHASDSASTHFHKESGLVRTGTLRHRKNGNLCHGQQEDRDHAELAAVDNGAVVAEAPLGGRDGVAQTLGDHVVWRLVCRFILAFLVSHLSNWA